MITRRTFLGRGLGAAAALSSLRKAAEVWAAEEVRPWSPVIDTMTPDGPDFDAGAALAGGLTAAVLDLRLFPRNFPKALESLQGWEAAFKRPDSRFFKVLKAGDLGEAWRQGTFGVILACQDAAILDSSTFSVNDRNLENLRQFHGLGLRVLQLTHNERNAVGDSFREKIDAGLSLLGEAVVKEMNAVGMLVDLSHCSDQTTLQAIRLSAKPCAVTHAGCRSLYPSLRNKPNEVIRALAEKGGYFGIYNMSVWLTDRETSSAADVLNHLDHAVKVGGIDLAGFGSDGPVLGDPTPQKEKAEGLQGYIRRNHGLPGGEPLHGHVSVAELETPRRMEILAAGLAKRGYKEDAIAKLLGGNFARVFGAVCG
jgi:membrane dipeptidase